MVVFQQVRKQKRFGNVTVDWLISCFIHSLTKRSYVNLSTILGIIIPNMQKSTILFFSIFIDVFCNDIALCVSVSFSPIFSFSLYQPL